MNLSVIIPAAGRSSRFGLGDKLSQDLGGRPMLMRTVELFAKRDEVRSIIVAGPPDDYEAFRERFAAALSFHGALVVEGGRAERWETVRNALAAVPEDATHIAVHDAARPGVSNELIDRVLEAAAKLPAVIPGVPIASTLKRVTADANAVSAEDDDEAGVLDSILGEETRKVVHTRIVVDTVDRANMIEVQTPQVFEAALLQRAYAEVDPAGSTDDASMIERLGEPVHVVLGDPRNFKVTTPEDLALMRALLGVKPPAVRPAHLRF